MHLNLHPSGDAGTVCLSYVGHESCNSMAQPARILYLEDNLSDVELVRARLAAEGIACEIVGVQTDFASALDRGRWALILADDALPSFDGMSALTLAQIKCPDVPFTFVAGTNDEDAAVEGLKNGASDHVFNQQPGHLVETVRRDLQEVERQMKLA